jgi:hypothetical protein
MENKHIQQVDFSNPNADKITSGTTNKPLENKHTAVEWLTEKLRTEFGFAFSDNIFEQAKQMEKQQIIDTFQNSRILSITNNCSSGKQYYNKNYKQK